MRGSPESVQVKFSAIEIKVQFTILLENFEEDFRLLMNDLTNLFAVHSSLKKKFQTIFPNYFYPKKFSAHATTVVNSGRQFEWTLIM